MTKPSTMIHLEYEQAKLSIDPRRGANTTSWSIEGQDILYVDPQSYGQPQVKYTGGNPIMFPIFSTLGLNGESHVWYDGKPVTLSQHGLARLSTKWSHESLTKNSVTLKLCSSQDTLNIFPWDFELTVKYTLHERQLILSQTVRNTGDSVLPFIVGFHPYFSVSRASNCEVTGLVEGTPCQKISNHGPDDLNHHLPHRFDFANHEINHHFVSQARHTQLIDRLSGRRIALRPDMNYPCLTAWSEPQKPFVCLEPVTGRRGAFETRENLIRLAPTKEWTGSIEFEVLSL
jgi:galactose mutarotase-like enzyme